jgi:hypothetical protein
MTWAQLYSLRAIENEPATEPQQHAPNGSLADLSFLAAMPLSG